MNIDWDEVAQDATDSPRGLLAELMGRVEDVEDIGIVWTSKDGDHHLWTNTDNVVGLVGMLELAKFKACMDAYDDGHEETA